MTRKYLIFLDIDGVFTSARVNTAHNASYDIWHRFDPITVDFMNKVHDTHPVEFVIMSTWKVGMQNDNEMNYHWVYSAFANAGFRGIIAKPWKTDPDNFGAVKCWDRAHEVKDYLENFGEGVEDFILFDDNRYRFNEVLGKKRLIQTDPDNGLLYKHMLNALSIMGTWEKKK